MMLRRSGALLAGVLLVGCGGSTGADGGGAVGGASGNGGASGSGGFGGSIGGSSADFSACQWNSDCVVRAASCCGSCGTATRSDIIALNKASLGDYARSVCDGVAGCDACAGEQDPALVATCGAGTCQVVDLQATDVTKCATDADCRLRTNQCCECGGDANAGGIISVNVGAGVEMMALLCDDTIPCGKCMPQYPAYPVMCSQGRCAYSKGLGGP